MESFPPSPYHVAPFVLPADLIEQIEALAIRAQTTRSVVAQAMLETAVAEEDRFDERIMDLKEQRKEDPSRFKARTRFGTGHQRRDAYSQAIQADLVPHKRWW